MATETNNLKLSKADSSDAIIQTLYANNNNLDIIDENISNLKTEVDNAISGVSIEGFTVIEASTDKIVDFNTMTEAGIYLVKNATATTTANSPSLGSAGMVIIEVGIKNNIVFQSVMTTTNNGIPYHRQNSDGTWSSWLSTIGTNVIRAGTLNSGMACNTPTANTHLANKAYVDSQVATIKAYVDSQVATIKTSVDS